MLFSDTLRLVRVLFPSWKFFDDFDFAPVLEFNVTGSWQPVLERHHTSHPFKWIYNPQGNLRMAQQSAVEHLVDEINDSKPEFFELAQTVSYQIVKALVQERVHSSEYQFRVRVGQDVVISAQVSED